jgi:hypothetical protein
MVRRARFQGGDKSPDVFRIAGINDVYVIRQSGGASSRQSTCEISGL